MRFLKGRQAPGSPEDTAIAARLQAVTGRGNAERVSYPEIIIPEPHVAPLPAPRLFWTPEEAAAA